MSQPKALILRAPGINCERETAHAFEVAGAISEQVHVKQLLDAPSRLDEFSIFVVPGGFAYGDDIGAGVVLAHEMRRKIGDQLLDFVERGGLALGICNGFQTLVRLGLLPRMGGGGLEQQVSLVTNLSDHYECRWVTLGTVASRCKFLPEGLRFRFPAAHAEGYLVPGNDETRAQLDDGYRALVYLDDAGNPTTDYPANPNGSPGGIAGLTDCTGRVLGMMPHPDRAYLSHHMPDWRRTGMPQQGDGMRIFEKMVSVAAGR